MPGSTGTPRKIETERTPVAPSRGSASVTADTSRLAACRRQLNELVRISRKGTKILRVFWCVCGVEGSYGGG